MLLVHVRLPFGAPTASAISLMRSETSPLFFSSANPLVEGQIPFFQRARVRVPAKVDFTNPSTSPVSAASAEPLTNINSIRLRDFILCLHWKQWRDHHLTSTPPSLKYGYRAITRRAATHLSPAPRNDRPKGTFGCDR